MKEVDDPQQVKTPEPAPEHVGEPTATEGEAVHRESGNYELYFDLNKMVAELSYLLINAKEVDIFGIAPHPLLEAIRQVVPGASSEPSVALAPIRYFTPGPQMVYGHTRETSFGALLQRWNSPVTAFDNLIAIKHASQQNQHTTYTAYVIDDLFVDCLVKSRNKDDTLTIVGLMILPGLPGREPAVMWQVNNPPPDLEEVVVGLTHTDKPLIIREVHCQPLDEERIHALAQSVETTAWTGPEIKGFNPYGGLSDHDFAMPVAVVVIRANTPTGVAVFLKRRTPLTDRADFGVLSLLSARVLEEDLAISLGIDFVSEPDATRALEGTWMRANKPQPFQVPLAAFFRAAQRELHASCGLTISADRFQFRGFQVVDHERNGQQLCFAVFDLALLRSSTLDELRTIESWNRAGMIRVDQDRLYSDVPDALPLNRLLKVRREWLTERVFNRPVEEG
jgi:hypothetical protein